MRSICFLFFLTITFITTNAVIGTLYGFSYDNYLVSIDPVTGNTTTIGSQFDGIQLIEGIGDIDNLHGIYYVIDVFENRLFGVFLQDGSPKINISLPSDGGPYSLAVDQDTSDVYIVWALGSDPSHSTYQTYRVIPNSGQMLAIGNQFLEPVMLFPSPATFANTRFWTIFANLNETLPILGINATNTVTYLAEYEMTTLNYDDTTGLIFGWGSVDVNKSNFMPQIISFNPVTGSFDLIANATGTVAYFVADTSACDLGNRIIYGLFYLVGNPSNIVSLIGVDMQTGKLLTSANMQDIQEPWTFAMHNKP